MKHLQIKKQAVPAPYSRAKLDLHPFSRTEFGEISYTVKNSHQNYKNSFGGYFNNQDKPLDLFLY